MCSSAPLPNKPICDNATLVAPCLGKFLLSYRSFYDIVPGAPAAIHARQSPFNATHDTSRKKTMRNRRVDDRGPRHGRAHPPRAPPTRHTQQTISTVSRDQAGRRRKPKPGQGPRLSSRERCAPHEQSHAEHHDGKAQTRHQTERSDRERPPWPLLPVRSPYAGAYLYIRTSLRAPKPSSE